MRRVLRAFVAGAAVACLSLPGSTAAQEAHAPVMVEDESQEDIAQRRERAALLAAHFNDAVKLHSMGIGLPILFSGMGGASLALDLGASTEMPRSTVFAWGAGSVTALAGGLAALAASETYRRNTLTATSMLSLGSYWMGVVFLENNGFARMTPIALSAGYFTTGLLSGLNLALSKFTPVSQLRTDHALVATPEWRARLSGAQVASIERDLLGTEPAIPDWAIYLPLGLGGVAAVVPALDGDLPAEKRFTSLALGFFTALWPLTLFEREHPANAYQRHLRRAGLRVAPSGPDGNVGLTVVGSF